MYLQYKGNICNRAQYCGSELPEYMALILRNGGSQSPDRWLKEPRNNQYPYTGYEYDGQKYHDVTYLGEFENDELPHNDIELMDILIKRQQKNK